MNASTTAMQLALTNAGLTTTPLNRRIWNYLKDHPRQTVKAVASVFKTDEDVVRTTLRQMLLRDMVAVTKEPRRVPGSRAGTNVRDILLYSTPHGMDEFELLPMSKRAERKTKPEPVTPPCAATPTIEQLASKFAVPMKKDLQQSEAHAGAKPNPTGPTPAVAPINLDNLTIGQARDLYLRLHRMFASKE